MDYQPYSEGARITPGSVFLLCIFVAAAAFLVTAVLWRPWFGDSAAPAVPPSVEAPAEQLVGAEAPLAPQPPAP